MYVVVYVFVTMMCSAYMCKRICVRMRLCVYVYAVTVCVHVYAS